MPTPPINGASFDHVALAVSHWEEAWPRYVTELGGQWFTGGVSEGFAPSQLRYANAARLEFLAPVPGPDTGFVDRFLATHGPGPHHMTFKVPDFAAALGHAKSLGYHPVGVDRSNPEWLQAFLHPRQATGIVVQLVQSSTDWSLPPPDDFPGDAVTTGSKTTSRVTTSRAAGSPASPVDDRSDGTSPGPRNPPAIFRRVAHAVPTIDEGMALFADLLGGTVTARGEEPAYRWADLAWASPLGLRLLAPRPESATGAGLARWLGARPGRVHHLELACHHPHRLAGARLAPEGRAGVPGVAMALGDTGGRAAWTIEPHDNLGVRLVLYPLDASWPDQLHQEGKP